MDLADLEIVDQEGHVRPEEVMKAADSEMDLEIMDSAEEEISVRNAWAFRRQGRRSVAESESW